jgi:hypothetical protein
LVPPRSRKASSIDNGSTSGVSRSISARTARPTSRYFAMSDRITTASAQAASALNIGVVERHAVESRDVAAGEHDTTGTAVDDDRPINEVWPVTLLDRGIKGVAIDVGDRQSVECGMADLAR